MLQACPVICRMCIPCGNVDGQFGMWIKVVNCSNDCKEGDIEVKLRECNDPAPMNGGAYCEGSPIIVKKREGCSQVATKDDLEEVCSGS